jgi:hypothetical protein
MPGWPSVAWGVDQMRSACGARGVGVVLLVATIAFPFVAAGGEDAAGAAEGPGSQEASWSVRASINTYIFTDQSDYVQPTVAVDHGALHLEGRYNYEAQRTGSIWVGWNFEWGESLRLALTPMVGGVFGELNGMAPGFELDLSWGPFELYSENEFVFDFADWSGSNYYAWVEASGSPFEWLRAGIAVQRSRAVAVSRAVQWGPLLGFKVWKLNASAYWFNPGQPDAQYWVLSVGIAL